MQIEDFLKGLDLTDKEIQVYLTCLELGESSIVPIKIKTGLPRTTVFHNLESLRDMGLIEIIETATRRMYSPHSPRKVMTNLRHRQEKYRQMADDLEKLMPDFNRLYSSSPFQPRIRFFRGEEIKAIYEEILETPVDEINYVGETERMTDILDKDFFKDWVARKVEKGIWTRSVWVRGKTDPYFDPREGLRNRRMGPEGFECPVHFFIYGDNVAVLTSIAENFGVVTTSREYANAMRNWFEQIWKVSTKE